MRHCVLLLILSFCTAIQPAASDFICAGFSSLDPSPAAAGKTVYPSPRPISPNGVHALILFAQFRGEEPNTQSPPSYAEDLFERDLPGSLAHFYDAMSFGEFQFRGTVLPRRYSSAQSAAAYLAVETGEKGQYGRFVEEILLEVDGDIDFGQFDNDGPDGLPNSGDDDGWVDYLFVNVLSAPHGFVMGGATGIVGLGLSAPFISRDAGAGGENIRIGGDFSQGSIGQEGSFPQTVGTMAHEFGHSLGLPDLYDLRYEDPATDSAGIGKWGLMGWGAHGWNGGDGPNPFCAWSLKQLGWIGVGNGRLVAVVDDTADLLSESLHSGGRVYSIPLRMPGTEYLLLERRTRSSTHYDRHLPGEGVLIWHIRPNSTNDDEGFKLVDLVCADGLYLDRGFPQGRSGDGKFGGDNLDFWAHDPAYAGQYAGNTGDATDPFDGSRFAHFGLHTNPSSDPRNLLPAAATGLEIDLRREQGEIRIDVTQSHWAGLIDTQVHWGGDVLVDGDLIVTPEGRLTIHPDTRVRLAGTDLLRGGRDPDLCELSIQGELIISRPAHTESSNRVIFQARKPGESWYGICFDPMTWVRNWLPSAGDYELRDAEYGLELLTREWPVLLMLGSFHAAGQQDVLLEACEEVLNNLGLKAAVVKAADVKGVAVFDELLSRYLGQERFVLCLGGIGGSLIQNSILRFLEDGGRLFMASRQPPSWYESIHITSHLSSTLRLSSAGLLEEPALDFETPYRVLDITAPAVPILRDEHNGVSGLRLETENRHLVYLPFDLQTIEPEMVGQLLTATLPLLGAESVPRAVLDIPGHEIVEYKTHISVRPDVLATPTISIPVRARVEGDVEGIELMVHGLNGMDLIAEIPMEETAPGEYEAEFRAFDSGEYLFWLRLRERGEGVTYSAQSLQVMALLFAEERPVLVFIGGNHLSSRKEALLVDLETVLQPLALETNILNIVSEKGFPYQDFLEHYLEPGKVVVWLGDTLDEEGQAVFGDFLERGGRLLMSSFGLRNSLHIDAFLREALGVTRIGDAKRSRFPSAGTALARDFFMIHRPLTLMEPALPLVVDQEGGVAGLRLDGELGKVVFLSFDLDDMESHTRRELLQTELAFLREPRSGRADLQVQNILAPAPVVSLGSLAPEIIIANMGGESSGPFQVGYQILQGEDLLFAAAREEAPLEGWATRETRLPAWTPVGAEDFQIRFGLGAVHGDSLAYSPTHPLSVVEGVEPFGELPLPGAVSAGNGAGFFDYDGDGDLDLYLVNEEANRFFRNDGDGSFSDWTEGLAVSSESQQQLASDASGRSAGFFDYDGDGDLDLYLVNSGDANSLFQNDAGQFTEVAAAVGLADAGNGRGLAVGDYDGDGDGDLFVANQTGGSHLFRNDQGVFQAVHQHLGLEFSGGEAGAVFGDYDDDGDLDLFISSEMGTNYLYRNDAGLSFQREVGQNSLFLGGQTVGTAFFDYDNDGDLDLATTALRPDAGGDALYQNRGDGAFIPVGDLLQLRPESSGRGLSFADCDGDGDLDLFIADSKRSHFYRNTADPTHWMQVELKGQMANRHGLGASVELTAEGRQQYRELQSTFGYGSQVQPRVHFGLGGAVKVDSLRVRWPDGLETVQFALKADQHLVLAHPTLSTAVTEVEHGYPGRFRLLPNYPNPFNSGTAVRFELPRSGKVELTVFNLLGQPVRKLVDKVRETGVHQIFWDGRDERGNRLGSGVFFCRLAGDGQAQVRRMLLLR